ncbi:MAG: TlpA disulfide reductase family protein [Schaedlerella sp.]|nr:TlpA disulfide reductase family protein [Schaedlerella sp.]
MKKVVIFLLSCLMLVACGKTEETQTNTEVKQQAEEVTYQELSVGDEAPDFTAELTDGSSFILSDYKGQVVLMNFWATWCSPCVGEMPAFEQLYKELGDQVEILAVNVGEESKTVNAFVEENGYNFPIAYDQMYEICLKYPSEGIPYTLVIGKDGKIADIYVGAADAQTQYNIYKSALEEAMKGE